MTNQSWDGTNVSSSLRKPTRSLPCRIDQRRQPKSDRQNRSQDNSSEFERLKDPDGYPGNKPPWGKITALNLNNGKIIWQIPFGEYEELTKKNFPITGTFNYGGVAATAGEIVFATGTLDNKIRGYNYMSLFFGYSRRISKTFLSAKIKILSGIGSFGFDPGLTTIFTSENSISYNTPFATLVSSDFTAYYTEKINMLSNLGVACDLSIKYHISENISMYGSVLDLGFIQWQENQLSSNGSYFFNGLDYNVDDDLVEGFTNVYDTIVDIFSIKEKENVHSTRYLPYETNFGFIYNFNDVTTKNQIHLNYNFKNLQVSEPFSTISIAYSLTLLIFIFPDDSM